jgi:hypothetical protein
MHHDCHPVAAVGDFGRIQGNPEVRADGAKHSTKALGADIVTAERQTRSFGEHAGVIEEGQTRVDIAAAKTIGERPYHLSVTLRRHRQSPLPNG